MPALPTHWLTSESADLAAFVELCSEPVELEHFRFAASVEHRTVVYDADSLRAAAAEDRTAVLAEISHVLDAGPGVIVIRGAVQPAAVEAMSEQFFEIIDEQRSAGAQAADHFAKAGANDRVWNALEKVALRSPTVFAEYYQSDMIALACEAWLGPWYQISSQVNVVNPGGEAQQPHRDYHLGFLSDEQAERFPRHVHRLSPVLTLQGAVAHCDMPVETGPTTYLPNSQRFEAGYLAWRREDFKAYFAEHHVQPSLQAGDAVFFNPALFHAAGTNQTADVRRIANLLQISSGFGRLLENIDRTAMCEAIYPELLGMQEDGASPAALDALIAATAEGYPFPTNLDRDPPIGGMVPPSQADVMRSALAAKETAEEFLSALASHGRRRQTR